MTSIDQPAILDGLPTVSERLKNRWPDIQPSDEDRVLEVLRRGILTGGSAGPECKALEKEWADFNEVPHALGVSSGTNALHLALSALEIGPGDEVIVPALTFSGSVLPVLYRGATPVFVDIDPVSYNIDPRKLEAVITPRTRAIIVVHLHGLSADMEPIMQPSARYQIPIIEDACQAPGVRYKEGYVGTYGIIGCFSLNHNKTLSGGEGGLVITSTPYLYNKMLSLRSYGEEQIEDERPLKFRTYECQQAGFNYRLPEMPAALARGHLARLNQYNQVAWENGQILTEGLRDLTGVVPPEVPPGLTSSYHKYRVRLNVAELGKQYRQLSVTQVRDRVLAALYAEGVEVAIWHYRPLPDFPVFQCYSRGRTYPAARSLLDSSILLNSELFPIQVQEPELMHQYVAAFRKVWNRLPQILR